MQRSVTFARKYFHPVASYAPAYTPFELEQAGQINSPCVELRRRVARKHFHQVQLYVRITPTHCVDKRQRKHRFGSQR